MSSFTRSVGLGLTTAALAVSLVAIPAAASADPLPDGTPFDWDTPSVVNNIPTFTDSGTDARGISPGDFGSQFPRMTQLADDSWMIVYTIYENDGYTHDPGGGTELQVARSTDDGRTWSVLATLSDPGRDLDNGHIVELDDGSLLLAYRSVIWQQSYRVQVQKSTNGGSSWSLESTIDSNEGGSPGSLGNPDRGVYEPFMHVLDDDRVVVMYANEKYALDSPAYAQVISMRVSNDDGASWGSESFPVRDLTNSASRPGMPVFTPMANDEWALVYELCGTDDCNAWIKTTDDLFDWGTGLGTRLVNQFSAPYIISLDDGRLVVTSNTHEISISRDFGETFYLDDTQPFEHLHVDGNLWPALAQTGSDEIAVVVSAGRPAGFPAPGHNIQISFGTYSPLTQPALVDDGRYTFTAQHSGLNLDVDGGSTANGAKVQQWTPNGLAPQNWFIRLQPDGSYLLENEAGGKFLDVDANSTADGATVHQWEFTGCACQEWFLDYIGGGLYQVRASHSGKNLDVAAGSTSAGAVVHQWPNNDLRPQRWRITEVP